VNAAGSSCDAVRADAAEFVLGTLDGVQRARIVEHIAECARCREEIATLADTVNDLTMLAAPMRPSAGFADRVLAAGYSGAASGRDAPRMAPSAPPATEPMADVVDLRARRVGGRRRLRAWSAVAVAAALVALAVGLAVRGTETSSGTTAFVAMIAPDGEVIGTSWSAAPGAVAVAVDYPSNWRDYRLEAVRNDGSASTLGPMSWSDGAWRWQGEVPDEGSVARLRVVRPDGQVTCWSLLPE
jgi:anti-sigma-K factor RskA